MVKTAKPNSQFQPYQPERSTPQTGSTTGGIRGVLRRLGLGEDRLDSLRAKMDDVDVRGKVDSARGYARNHGGLILGSMAALAIGAGLMSRRRAMR
jgi:hypothetical protein